MNHEFLESAEFYNRRYHNFSSRVIIPTAVLLVFVLLFALFATKEITVTAGATIEPNRIIANIQSTSNNAIVTNNLAENKTVKQGDLLIQYQGGAETVQEATYASQLDMLRDQKQQLEYLQASLETGSDSFPAADNFGYQQAFQDYLSQAGTLRANTDQQNATIASQNAAAANSQAELGNLIAETQAKIADYQTAKSAIQNGTTLDSANVGYSLYQTYQAQAEADNTGALKSQTIAQVDAQIAQLEGTLSGYRVQYAGTGAQQAYSGSLSSQLESLKAQQLTRVAQELTSLDQKILDAEAGKQVQGGLVQKGFITASEDGVLHLNPETSHSSLVPEGTLLAQLYPLLTTEKKVKITAYISSKDIAQLKVGDRIRFTTVNDTNKQINLTSTISQLDSTATKSERGNFFKLEAETQLTEKEADQLRYGLEGRVVMITGKKTYFQYYLDQFLRRE
ncbi:Competence-stimulating peptide ABC transporter permease protein ComB [Streptococcus sp. DD10]|uniref:bacteriocin secretion accessory protein n=1 Tax=Streptococcus sp. DD10 TaxID=1777878 RepID=UPI00079C07E1|nr:bacteriocin secretion accessory protein [Streptococcus sp. DD10]KXT74295.1 Competence-stimulating peptide ABC transporter permease protein ComB [Streptococcus sp. DD10]